MQQVVFAYSDVEPRVRVMHLRLHRTLAAGADFILLGPREHRCWRRRVPVIAVSAVRTGCGKSPVRPAAGCQRHR